MENPKNARPDILDTIELIANQIALSSHMQELVNVAVIDIETAEDDGIAKMHWAQKKLYETVLQGSVDLRRKIMQKLESEVAKNPKLWCAVKHVIASYQYATEIAYAHPEDIDYKKIQQEAYEQMIQVLSTWTGEEMVTCGRCWLDALNETTDGK